MRFIDVLNNGNLNAALEIRPIHTRGTGCSSYRLHKLASLDDQDWHFTFGIQLLVLSAQLRESP